MALITRDTRIVVEKPIGRDLDSAKALNDTLGSVFREDQIFRIDHYLGKETVQNLMALRFANALYEPLWNSAHIDHVQITVAEAVGLEGRAGYYDKAGALRRHGAEPHSPASRLAAMEPPSSIEADAVHDEKVKVLRSLQPISTHNVEELTVRGQYRAGASAGGPVKGYLEDLESDTSNTETFVALKAEIANWRWAGVPFYLRTGKRLCHACFGNRRHVQAHSAFHLWRKRGQGDCQSACHPPATGRRREAMADDQGSRSGWNAPAPHAARHELCGILRGSQPGCL